MQHFGEAADRGERRAQLITHVGDEGGLHPVRRLQRLVAIAQRLLDPSAVGNVQHREQPVAIGQRHRGEFEMAPIGKGDATAALFALHRGGADQLADQAGARRIAELGAGALRQIVDARMRGKECVVEPPHLGEARVPQLQPAVRGKDAQRLEQIVERRGADAQQRVARTGELDLLGAVLEHQQQAAIGQRLGEQAQVLAPGEMPILLHRARRREPFAPLHLPARKIADFGQTVGFPHAFEHAIELRLVGDPFAPHREQAAKRLVAEYERAIGGELRHAGGKPIEHGSLRLGETPDAAARLLQILDIDRETGDAAGRQRHVEHPQRAPRAADRRRHHLLLHLAGIPRGHRAGKRAAEPGRLDQLDAAFDHLFRIRRLDGAHIGGIDHRQPQVRPAIPHRQRRDLDQPGQRFKGGAEPRPIGFEADDLALSLGRVEHPDDHRTRRTDRGRRPLAANHQRPFRSRHPHAHAEVPAGPPRAFDRLHQQRRIIGGQAIAFAAQLNQEPRRSRQAEPIRDDGRDIQPTVRRNDQRLCGARTGHRIQPSAFLFGRACLPLAPQTDKQNYRRAQ